MERVTRAWDLIEIKLSGLITIAATSIIIYAISIRYVTHQSPSWAIEIVIYLLIWATFLLSSSLIRDGGHVGADFVTQLFSIHVQRRIEIATTLLALPFTIVVTWFGVLHVYDLYDFGARSTTALRFPLWIAQAAVPVGTLLISIRLVQRACRLLRDINCQASPEVEPTR